MIEKKLLTLAAVVGILACGACFMGPLPDRQPPPPPIRNGFKMIHSIRVEVANTSPSHHLDPAALARKIAETINDQSQKTKVSAHVGKKAGDGDAVLAITILSETVGSAKPGRMTFLLKDSATLTRLGGTLVWQETDAGNWITRHVDEENASDAWKEPGLVDGVEKALSGRLVFRIFYGH